MTIEQKLPSNEQLTFFLLGIRAFAMNCNIDEEEQFNITKNVVCKLIDGTREGWIEEQLIELNKVAQSILENIAPFFPVTSEEVRNDN